MDLKAATISILRADSEKLIFLPETRSKLAQAATELEQGKRSTESADSVVRGATLVLIRAFQTGEAFAASVPAETREAREQYLLGEVAKLIPKLRQNGLESAIVALEGAKATADFAQLGHQWVEATGKNAYAELDRDIDAHIARAAARNF